MKYSLLGALALVGALVACSGSTSPESGNSTSLVGSDSTGSTGGGSTSSDSTTPPASDSAPPAWPTYPPHVSLSFIHTAPQFGRLNLYVNSVLAIDDQNFSTGYTSRYLYGQVSSVPQTVTVTPTSDPTTVLASVQVTFDADTQYTVVFTQHSPNGGLIVLLDTVSAPPPGNMSFRLVNAAPSVGAVDVYATTGSGGPSGLTPVASNLSFEAVSPYVSFPADPTRIIITAAGDPSTVLYETGTGDATAAGKVWTIILMHNDGNGLDEPLTSLWIRDRS